MTRKGQVILAVVVLVLVVVVGAVLMLMPNADEVKEAGATPQTPSTKQTESTSTSKKLTQENATLLEAALNSSSKDEQGKALVPEMRGGEWSPQAVMPDGATLTIDRESFAVDAERDQLGTVQARVTGSVQGEFLLRLMQQPDGTWLLFQSEQLH